ncbi:SCO7613 C-terminal domain-containing membrane protein [Streptomyces chilikensis]|uniref:Integral membrane protein n=1 Tax=Streptomyces chilikensis TaxID=1194079 RepID=A0ABV3EVG7_9ACTN
MTTTPPPAEELRLIDAELRTLDARRAQLLARRGRLIGVLWAADPPVASPARVPPAPGPGGEASGPDVQNLLLLLGGLLLGIASLVFTLVAWGSLGLGGRAAVLGALTAVVLASPVPLLRRGLRATAESLTGLGMTLTVLDAYALHRVALADVPATTYAAGACALLAAVWAGYGLLFRELRGPWPAAAAVAQPAPALWASDGGAGSTWLLAAALLTTAALGTAAALWLRVASVRWTAGVGACVQGACGVLVAGWLSVSADGPGAAFSAALLLAFAAVVAAVTAWRLRQGAAALAAAVVAGVLAVAAAGGPPRAVLPPEWEVPGYLACALLPLGAVRTPLPRVLREGALWASAGVQGAALLWALPLPVAALLEPVAPPRLPHEGPAAVVLAVLAVLAAVSPAVAPDEAWRARGRRTALVLGAAVLYALPTVFELPREAGLAVRVLVVAGALAFTRRTAAGPWTAMVVALVASGGAALSSMPGQWAALAVLPALIALFTAVSLARRPLAPAGLPAALVHAALLVCVITGLRDWEASTAGLLLLGVTAAAALVAARPATGPATVPVEVTGAVAGACALLLTLPDPPVLALALALAGVIAGATALRPGRRPAGCAAGVLFVLAAWVRLAAWGVGTPEAYALPAAVPMLALGVLRRRRDASVSSWPAYGPGLSAALLPGLVAAWADPHWTRPLLLGLAALAVTVAGAVRRLRAPLLLGGTVLVLDALHELAPYLVQALGALPRWAPPAAAGLLLLLLGTTYERRLRDARRAREALRRMG